MIMPGNAVMTQDKPNIILIMADQLAPHFNGT